MNIALWIVQVLLALAFGMSGFLKVSQPVDKLAARMVWVNDFASRTVRLIGAVEILGAIGLLLPAITGIWTWLTPLAAVGLALTMVGALLVHMRRKEFPMIGANVVLLLLALFVVYGRFVAMPF